jgi:ACR3 family arsenite efflux pump ArsB
MVFPMMVTLRYRELFTRCAFLTQGLTQGYNLVVIPALGYFLGRLFFADSPYLALGLFLAAVIPTSGMTASWTGFARGNVEVAVKMMIIGLTAGSLLTPLYVKYLLGASASVEVGTVLVKIIQEVFIPMGAGIITRTILMKKLGPGWFKEKAKGIFPPPGNSWSAGDGLFGHGPAGAGDRQKPAGPA